MLERSVVRGRVNRCVDADAIARCLQGSGVGEIRQRGERDDDTIMEGIEALETINSTAVLSETIGERSIVIEDPALEQVEDAGSIRVESVIPWPAEYRESRWDCRRREIVGGLAGVRIEGGMGACTGNGTSVCVVVTRSGLDADVGWSDHQLRGAVQAGPRAANEAGHVVSLHEILTGVTDGYDRSDFGSPAVAEDGRGVFVVSSHRANRRKLEVVTLDLDSCVRISDMNGVKRVGGESFVHDAVAGFRKRTDEDLYDEGALSARALTDESIHVGEICLRVEFDEGRVTVAGCGDIADRRKTSRRRE